MTKPTRRLMTPKQRFLRTWPDGFIEQGPSVNEWTVYAFNLCVAGTGRTARSSWLNAYQREQTRAAFAADNSRRLNKGEKQ